MKLVVFGASGGTGRELVRQALAQGNLVTAFLRDPVKLGLKHANLNVLRGDVTDRAAVERAVAGRDAVLCALGSSSVQKRDAALVEGVQNIIDAMGRAGVRRLIYQSYLGVRDSRDQLGFVGQRVIAPFLLRNPVADHEEKEALITHSRLDWTIVRPPKLTDGRRTGAYRSGERLEPRSIFPTISRADVAEFMLRQVTDAAFLRKAASVMP